MTSQEAKNCLRNVLIKRCSDVISNMVEPHKSNYAQEIVARASFDSFADVSLLKAIDFFSEYWEGYSRTDYYAILFTPRENLIWLRDIATHCGHLSEVKAVLNPAAYVEQRIGEIVLAITTRLAETEKKAKEADEAHKQEMDKLKVENENLKQELTNTKGLVTAVQEEATSAKQEAQSAKEEAEKALERVDEKYSKDLSALVAEVKALKSEVANNKELILRQQSEPPHEVIHAPTSDCSECNEELRECNDRLDDCHDSYASYGKKGIALAGQDTKHLHSKANIHQP